MAGEAYSVVRTFPAASRQLFRMPMHYILYCTAGVLRMEAEGRIWSLPPARAAIVRANERVEVTLPHPVTACSVLLARDFVAAPPTALSVVNMSPLARELIRACGAYGEDAVLDNYGRQLFGMLAQEVYRLAATPSRTAMPAPVSPALIRAVALTEERMADRPSFEEIASAVAMTPRSLARHFAQEMGLSWRDVLRRLRIIRAMELLAAESASVADAAFATGYSSLSAFNAAFRDIAGEAPTEFRRGLRSSPIKAVGSVSGEDEKGMIGRT